MTETPTLYALTGVVYSGKTTLSNAITEATGIPLVSYDAVKKELGFSSGIKTHMQGLIYSNAYKKKLFNHLLEGRSVISDGIHLVRREFRSYYRADRDYIRQLAAEAGAKLLFVYVNTSEEIIWERWRKNQ